MQERGEESLEAYRNDIDNLDQDILEILAIRFRIASKVAAAKNALGIPARIEQRIKYVIESREQAALKLSIPEGAAAAIWTTLVEETCKYEEHLTAVMNNVNWD